MSVSFTRVNTEGVRRRLQAMADDELLRFGKAAASMCTPDANYGKPPREVFQLQLQEARAEWRRRRQSYVQF